MNITELNGNEFSSGIFFDEIKGRLRAYLCFDIPSAKTRFGEHLSTEKVKYDSDVGGQLRYPPKWVLNHQMYPGIKGFWSHELKVSLRT